MGNSEKEETWGTQDEDKPNKKRNTICVGHQYAQVST